MDSTVDLSALPRVAGVYFVFGDGELVYIGKSFSIRQRWGSRRKRDIGRRFKSVQIAWLVVTDGTQAEQERQLIRALRPALNRMVRTTPAPPEYLSELITVKVTSDTRRMLRLLSAHSGKDIYDIAESLAWAEMKRKKIEPSEVLKKAQERKQNGQTKTVRRTGSGGRRPKLN